MVEHDLPELGPITKSAKSFFSFLQYLAPMRWLQVFCPLLRPMSKLPPNEVALPEVINKRGRAVDYYILGYLFINIVLSILVCIYPLPKCLAITATVIVTIRIVEILQVTINAIIFDQLRRPDILVASSVRMVVLAAINFFELCMCFGVLYALNSSGLKDAPHPATAFYFSIITMLTIGYGDVYPTVWYLKALVSFQGLIGLAFVILVFARVVTSLPHISAVLDTKVVNHEPLD